jgi:putative sigma-54 modulation protein
MAGSVTQTTQANKETKAMQVHNVNPPIVITGRHVEVTPALREYVEKKIHSLHLDYPRIIEAKVVLDVQTHHNQQKAEIILFCANHIVIEVDSTTHDLYASIDESIAKIARRMRKFKTRMLKSNRPKRGEPRRVSEHIYEDHAVTAHMETDEKEHIEANYVHKEQFAIRPLFPDEAIMDLEMSERPFVLFNNPQTGKLTIVYRRKDGDYGMLEPDAAAAA